jgi:UDP-N-acetylglucosamine 2-epimerase (non-hydrolysing)
MSQQLKVILVGGARPNFMKIAPIINAINVFNDSTAAPRHSKTIQYLLVHTGQHYDVEMSETFFREFKLPKPHVNLGVGSASHAVQTANIMVRFEEVCLKERPDWVVVVGDVNSTMACSLVASKIQYDSRQHSSTTSLQNANGLRPSVAHVEAGLRSFDRSMPEEINRIVTDALSDLLFTPSGDADHNLLREGIPTEKIKRVGNIMIDTLASNLDKARARKPYEKFGFQEKEYAFVTLHRPLNVDEKVNLSRILNCLGHLSDRLPVIFPVHPRTRKSLTEFGLYKESNNHRNFILCEPVGYQEETTFLGIPCLTLRPNTERPITISQGTNKLTSLDTLEKDFDYALNGYHPAGRIPDLWDGKTAQRIVEILVSTNRATGS